MVMYLNNVLNKEEIEYEEEEEEDDEESEDSDDDKYEIGYASQGEYYGYKTNKRR